MTHHRFAFACLTTVAVLVSRTPPDAAAQVVPRANWIWFDEGDPLKSAPVETVYFRKTFEENYELQEAEIHITCDNEFVLFINGKEVGRGSEWKDGRVFNVQPHLQRGKNVVAVRAANQGGPAGLVAWLVRLTKPGNHYTVLTDATWKCSKEAPEGWREVNFDDSKWSAPKVLGEFGKAGPWQEIAWNGKRDASRFTVKEGFTVELVAEPELTGSIVNMTFDWKGRPVISRERGPVFILEDSDGDGKFDKAIEYTDKVKNCQGILCYDRETYYLVGDGPDGTGLYRLKDTDADDKADTVETIHKFRGGMGEHGPHAIIVGPDGYLYFNSGNHAWVSAEPEPGSPVVPWIAYGQLHDKPETDRTVKSGGVDVPLRTLIRGYDADVLPRYEDAGGHAVGIRTPGGTIWRLDPEGKHWSLETCGFRNEFDIAFNSLGELFSFDSDMEWDEFLPWYRPVRVNHCPPGADFGWRSGSNKWPPYYVDSLPAILDTGRGSPCGVVFYHHTAFPEKYHDAFFITDWSYGRIFAVFLKRDGASFKAEAEEFVTGKPLNVVDIEVAPDGSLFFATGGRNTEGGVFRIRSNHISFPDDLPLASAKELAIDRALSQPQPQSAWGREAIRRFREQAGERQWDEGLEAVALDRTAPVEKRIRAISYLMQFGPESNVEDAHLDVKLMNLLTKDQNPEIRAQVALTLARGGPGTFEIIWLEELLDDPAPIVQRRALEGLIRVQLAVPLDKLRPLLAHKDRILRYTARLALERVDPSQWCDVLGADKDPRVVIMWMIALNRIGWVATNPAVAETVLSKTQRVLQTKLPPEDELDLLRALELTLVNTAPASGGRQPADGDRTAREDISRLTPAARQQMDAIGKLLLTRFPVASQPHNRELSRLIAAVQVPGGTEKLLREIEKIGSTESLDERAEAIHLARCLTEVTDDWTWEQRQRFLAWFDVSRDWKGGHSYAGYITNFLHDTVSELNDEEALSVVQNAAKFSRAATNVVQRVNDKVDAAFVPALAALLESDTPPVPRDVAIAALGATGRAESEAILLRLYDDRPAERDAIVHALANFQNARNWPIFVRALDSQNTEVVRSAVKALVGIDQKPDGPAAYRAAIQASARLGDQTAWDGIVLLRQWSGKHFGHKKNEWKAELAKWQKWYAESYPDAPAATLAEVAKPQHNWTYDRLLAYIEGDGRSGSVEAGKKIFEKAVCSKCHKIEQVGQSIGPDLTTLASRFKRKDILEAIIYPSRVISDQYKSYLIATKDGRVITAMKAPDDGDNLVLLLSDATTIKLPKADVDEMAEGKQSVMPDGLLNQFSLEEIADLFAFLESGKAAAPAANGQNK